MNLTTLFLDTLDASPEPLLSELSALITLFPLDATIGDQFDAINVVL